jgi:hypothetical protein
LVNRFGNGAGVYPFWRELFERTHKANPASRHGSGNACKTK